MVCLSQVNPISPEARELIATRPYYHEGLRRLAALLPASDAELHQWLGAAAEAMDGLSFIMLISAAAMGRRKLQASLLTPAMLLQVGPWVLGWIAWRMEGNVTEELVRGLETVTCTTDESRALALFVAAAWWLDHRKSEELPQQIQRLGKQLSEKGNRLDTKTQILLRDVGLLIGGAVFPPECVKVKLPSNPLQQRKELDRIFALLKRPFEKCIHERETHEYRGNRPQRRAVEAIGRNEKCRCGSGKKYKKCCVAPDRKRLLRSSAVPGVTRDELVADAGVPLTEVSLIEMGVPGISRINPAEVHEEMQETYLVTLGVVKLFDEIIAAFRIYGVPERLHAAWSYIFSIACDSWRPDVARALMQVFPEAEEKLGVKAHSGIRFLLLGDDPARALPELERLVEDLLQSGDLEDLQKLIQVLLVSPYRGLGILIARSVLPIVDEKYAPGVFDSILDARAKLNLSPEDEFGDWMDERTLRQARQHETAATQEEQDRLAAKMEELRAVKEQRAQLERELALGHRQDRREREQAKASTGPDEQAAKERAELKSKIESLNALVSQRGEEKLALRRALEKSSRENEALKSAGHDSPPAEESNTDEHFRMAGNQPVRLIEFPEGFAETLAGFPRHVGRAAMNRLGRLASGEPGGFERVKQLKTYTGVLRARVADKYRLLFCLRPDHIRVIDLIRRADLDRRIERLQASGLPPIA